MEQLVSRKIDYIIKDKGRELCSFGVQQSAIDARDRMAETGWQGLEVFARTTDTVQDTLKIA